MPIICLTTLLPEDPPRPPTPPEPDSAPSAPPVPTRRIEVAVP